MKIGEWRLSKHNFVDRAKMLCANCREIGGLNPQLLFKFQLFVQRVLWGVKETVTSSIAKFTSNIGRNMTCSAFWLVTEVGV
jgi:hypothetical protein